jgi:hypothetical protein
VIILILKVNSKVVNIIRADKSYIFKVFKEVVDLLVLLLIVAISSKEIGFYTYYLKDNKE